tara:strand:- start:577 stop:1059 length:483 start_codon:yes stop_codon:yes gene_type:complete
MKNKHGGFLVIAITIVFFFVVLSYNNALEQIVNATCTHGLECPMHVTLRTQQAISYGLMSVLLVVGLMISFLMKDKPEQITKGKKNLSEKERGRKLQHLDDKEKIIMNIILRENGSVYQSEIVRETKQSKVKITRILDQLEGKGLIERRRRGMTNIIILK